MQSVQRFDFGSYAKPELLDNGWMRAEATPTRCGVFPYKRDDGEVYYELRHPEDVFDPESLRSLGLVPITIDHPKDFLDDKNTGDEQVGQVGRPWNFNLDVNAEVMVTDGEAVDLIKSGKKVQLSCGYTCELQPEEGEYLGLKYTARQRNIRYNHVAIVEAGRMGPKAKIHADQAEAIPAAYQLPQSDTPPARRTDSKGGTPMSVRKMKIDGYEFEIPEQAAQALERERVQAVTEIKNKSDELKAAAAERDREKARADASEADTKKLKAELDAATDPKAIAKKVDARVALVAKAKAVLGAEAKFDDLDELAIKRAVTAKVFPDLKSKIDSEGEAYVGALFDLSTTKGDDGKSALDKVRGDITGGTQKKDAYDEALAKWKDKSANAHKIRAN